MTCEHPLRPWLERQADRIEATCHAHRIPLRVHGGVVTPRLVRFHLALDPAIPLKRLAALQEDLALALDAPSARLARRNGSLALELPRPDPALLSLVRLQAALPPLPPCTALLGRDESGAPLLLRLSAPEVSHLLLAGTTGSGKTALARAILASLALANDPDDLRFLLLDPNGHGFAPFLHLPHLLLPPLRQPDLIRQRLAWLTDEMLWREESGLRSPRVLVAVDEVADLIAADPLIGDLLSRLAARGRQAGLHLLLCTQKPSADAIGSLLRANLPCRLVGRVLSPHDALLAAGIKQTGAERLLGRGDFLLVAAGETIRFQAAFISHQEITLMVEMLQDELAARRPAPQLPQPQPDKIIPLPKRWVQRVVASLAR